MPFLLLMTSLQSLMLAKQPYDKWLKEGEERNSVYEYEDRDREPILDKFQLLQFIPQINLKVFLEGYYNQTLIRI